MPWINKAVIMGNVGRDPEIRSFDSGDRCASFSIATTERWKGKDGQRKEKTEWHNVSVLNQNLVGIVEKYVHKGTKVYIEGKIETRKWVDRNGENRYSTEIVLRPYQGELLLMGSKDGGEGRSETGAAAEPVQTEMAETPTGDEIPF